MTQFRGLKLIGSILKFIGVIGLFLAVISLVVMPLAFSNSDTLLRQLGFAQNMPGTGLLVGLLLGLLLFFLGVAAGMLLFAIGECFNVLIAIETNTRETLTLLQKSR
jgi:xanthine/uracil/vitamin C permease (AzgA family)